jgi:phosphoglycerate dehydrogenase-like enzyme
MTCDFFVKLSAFHDLWKSSEILDPEELDIVISTPHNAALTRECMDRTAVDAAQAIHEVLSGRTVTWLVIKCKTI